MNGELEVGKIYIAHVGKIAFITAHYLDENGDEVYDYYYLNNPSKTYTTLLHDATFWREYEI